MLLSAAVNRRVRAGRSGLRVASPRARATAGCRIAIMTICLAAAIGCDANSGLQRLSQAHQLSADVLVQFTKAADAANRTVMADTDEASVAFAGEAEQAQLAVQKDAEALKPVLQSLAYTEEARLLEEFGRMFSEYRALDRTILELAVENTNLKAQRLSFGPGQETADSFRESLQGVARSSSAPDAWHIEALVARAVAAVREIQVLQAPHIAAADESLMADLEKRIAASEAEARRALQALAPLVPPAHRSRLATASAALDRFMDVNAQIMTLSRRNTNVRSLALSLNQKRTLTAACETSLQALRSALAKRGFSGIR
jgi:hypothetical protein